MFFVAQASFQKCLFKSTFSKVAHVGGAGAVLGTGTNGNRVYGWLNVGYRKQSTDYDPLFWRATFTPLLFRTPVAGAGFLGYFTPSIGLAVGYGF